MMYSWFIFANNMTFSASGAWHYKRQYNAMLTLNNMVRFPGEPLINFLPDVPLGPRAKSRPIRSPPSLGSCGRKWLRSRIWRSSWT